ncbi:hypothetical protein E2P81_ATG02317 [Venturia nashicola]|uniref:Required for respiratory growth protein 9, mitochondrial n=1 Tax=Venturia nashicola TaxID=86259 RepID=A0A4Z1PA84_9PEZI|nr:hypothetical protein E6O75_ATG02374 [Venturia nashicola]TLD36535.1 hypothetical protein E2P81_ATG02317 [Venturia nashicola]
MICLFRPITSIRPILNTLTRRPIPTTIQSRALPVRFTSHWHPDPLASAKSDSDPLVSAKSSAKNKKEVRRLRRAQEKAEAKIPGTEGFLKAQRKAEKLANKQARKARIAAGEKLIDEVDVQAGDQAKRDKEALAKRRAQPVRRQERRDFKAALREEARKTPEERERGFNIRRGGQPLHSRRSIVRSNSLPGASRIRSPDYKPRFYKTKEDYALERATRGDSGKTHDGSDSRSLSYQSREDTTWGSGEKAPQDFLSNHWDRNGGSTKPAGAFSPSSDRLQYGTRDTANWHSRGSRVKSYKQSSRRSGHRQQLTSHNDRSAGRDFDRTGRPHNSDGDRSKAAFASRSRSDGPFAKREPWMIQKEAVKRKIGGEAWAPPKRLSPDTLEAIRTMHKSDPDKFSTPILARQFKQSPEVIRRILRTRWQPNEEEVLDRRARWERRGEKIWTKQAELGVRPPKKWREMGVANTGEPGVAPRYKKNAHASDRYGERPKHVVAQRRGASSDYDEAGFGNPFSQRIL